ncbi:protein lifeguard 2-like [Galendromus occidentalis]|uniref:Protein lifeguard 2-like n=1 Tax=Galendromus occidentalis TaxID=34638 RepID=A0AAJ7L6X1_9ACAR|nr:protein lifeguard 2-like [Galendromus occidentalis]
MKLVKNPQVYFGKGEDDKQKILKIEEYEHPESMLSFMRVFVLRTLFYILWLHLVVLTSIVAGALFIDVVRDFVVANRELAYIAFVLMPSVHCLLICYPPVRSCWLLLAFVTLFGYVEAAVSAIFNTYCIFMTDFICLLTCSEVIVMTFTPLRITSNCGFLLVLFLHFINFGTTVILMTSKASSVDVFVTSIATWFGAGVMTLKVNSVVAHFEPRNFV